MRAALIYPHQLFENHPALEGAQRVFLVEDPLLFSQYRFHVQKLILHRASMSVYADGLRARGWDVERIELAQFGQSEAADFGKLLKQRGIAEVCYVDLNDDWMEQRLSVALTAAGITRTVLEDPHFLTPLPVFSELSSKRGRWFFTDFYIGQRKRLGILLDEQGKPEGGKWSYDPENRKKLPKGVVVPPVRWPAHSATGTGLAVREAVQRVQTDFPSAPGDSEPFRYPVSHGEARACLQDFLDRRLADFGQYEDAIDRTDPFLFHSVLTPALNIGLLSPREVVDAALARADAVPLNSLEGFVRQVIGWREYMRGVYRQFGRQQRSRNVWNHHRPMPAAFYNATTGIEPVDAVIRRVLKHSYCHHIERLMILGNFLMLCEVSPDAVYQWFMELFIDAYDWVMVPNVYGMSQHADGGMITTKPYISGSAYVLKMSNFSKGPWCPIWDALYWRFISRHREFFAKNPRMSVMVSQCDKMGSKLDEHLRTAERFLNQLH
jgi:deoxyribodipyrimidine photolyase-related protein